MYFKTERVSIIEILLQFHNEGLVYPFYYTC